MGQYSQMSSQGVRGFPEHLGAAATARHGSRRSALVELDCVSSHREEIREEARHCRERRGFPVSLQVLLYVEREVPTRQEEEEGEAAPSALGRWGWSWGSLLMAFWSPPRGSGRREGYLGSEGPISGSGMLASGWVGGSGRYLEAAPRTPELGEVVLCVEQSCACCLGAGQGPGGSISGRQPC